MKLTGKLRTDLSLWLYQEYKIKFVGHFEFFLDCVQNAYIKKFFELHNIQFGIEPMQGGEIRGFILDNKFTHHWVDDRFESEEELIKVLIPLANLIYNKRK